MSDALGLFRCASCKGELSRGEGRLSCAACGATFPILNGVPCVLPNAGERLAQWRAALHAFLGGADTALRGVEAELRKPGQLSKTASRLEERRRGTERLRAEIDAAVGALIGAARPAAKPVPPFQALSNLQILFRDWGWATTEENREALTAVEAVAEAPLGRTLVIGAGGGRLAYDLHRTRGATETIAIDIDPIYVAIASQIVAGKRVALTETTATRCETYELGAPDGPALRLTYAFADGLAPPFADGCFDTVLTPWFIDQVPGDLRDFCGVVRRLLAPDGRWVSFGPAVYPAERPASCRFSFDEVLELVGLAGFEVERSHERTLVYLRSPLSEHARIEPCLAFSARRIAVESSGPSGERGKEKSPPWIVIPSLPVPARSDGGTPSNHPSSAVRAILDLVDGRRSVDDIAGALAARSGMPAADLKDSVRYTLLEHHRF